MTPVFRCPICRKKVERQNADFPFCSERCRLIDLGNWSDGSYTIAGEPAAREDDEDEERLH